MGGNLIVAYDTTVHSHFVFSAFCRGSGERSSELAAALASGAKCWVHVGSADPSIFMGYVVVQAGEVVWCYTKTPLRNMGLMRCLLAYAGIDVKGPIVARHWSPVIQTLNHRGWKIALGVRRAPLVAVFDLDTPE